MEQYIPQPDMTRTPPNHPESERSVLGAMLRSRQAAQLAVERLNAADFYDPANREIFAAMNLHLGNGQMAEAQDAYRAAVSDGHKAADCLQCRKCEQACPQHLPITDHLKQAAELFIEK